MKISINGINHDIQDCASIQQVIEYLQASNNSNQVLLNGFVVALNQTFVPRSQYLNTQLQEHDAIELLSPMAGG